LPAAANASSASPATDESSAEKTISARTLFGSRLAMFATVMNEFINLPFAPRTGK